MKLVLVWIGVIVYTNTNLDEHVVRYSRLIRAHHLVRVVPIHWLLGGEKTKNRMRSVRCSFDVDFAMVILCSINHKLERQIDTAGKKDGPM